MQSWPRIALTIMEYKSEKSVEMVAKGSVLVPFQPGFYCLPCHLGMSDRSRLDDLRFHILHEGPKRVEDDMVIFSGFARLEISVIIRKSFNGVLA